MENYCEKCGKTMNESQFYTYKNGSKTEICKKCMTMHIDNFNPDTFLWLLEKMDVPYIPEEWNVIRDRAFAKNPVLNGMSVFGKYLAKMKLSQFKDKVTGKAYGWADTEKLQAINEEKNRLRLAQQREQDEAIKERYKNGEISDAEYKTLMSIPSQKNELLSQNPAALFGMENNPFNENNFIQVDDYSNALAEQLTEEDKTYLLMKWGKLYKPSEWVELEKTYTEMTASFDIQDADTINSLILICKTNLKMNQSLDQGDIEGFQKLSKVSESLRKSAKFTAAQNKEEKSDYVDSVGELVEMCEKEGFIPRYATDIPQDKVDITLKDMESYLYKLVTQDLGFGQQIEDALKKIQIQKEISRDNVIENLEKKDNELGDEDYMEFYEYVEQQKKIDEEEEDDN